jgi:hypothetical protein
MTNKSGRRTLAGVVSKVLFEALERRILLSAGDGTIATLKFLQQPIFDPTTNTVSATVEVLDAAGNPTGSGTSVSLEASYPDPGEFISVFPKITGYFGFPIDDGIGALAYPSAVVGANGIATFTGLHVTDEGTYTAVALSFTSTSEVSQQSNSFQVGASDSQAPIPLGWIDENARFHVSETPASATVGNPLAPITVEIWKPDGSGIDTSYNGAITISVVDGGPAGGTDGGIAGEGTDGLSGMTVTAVNGVATFSGLTITKAAPYYELEISEVNGDPIGGGRQYPAPWTNIPTIPATPPPVGFVPSSSSADSLYFSQLPLYAVAGSPLSANGQGLAVSALKADGSLDSGYNGDITVTVSPFPGGSQTTTVTATASNGVATFNDLTISAGGQWYSLTATDANGDLDVSTNASGRLYVPMINVLPVGATPQDTPTQLKVIQPPTVDPSTGTFSLLIVALDEQGNPISDGSYVSLNIYSGPAGALLSSATGANPIQTVSEDGQTGNTAYATVDGNGLATFSGLSVSVAGVYRLQINNGEIVTDSFEAPATIVPPPAQTLPPLMQPPPAPVPLPAPTVGAPDTLYISHSPLYAVEGSPLSADGQYLTVEVLKADGTVDTSYNGDVTVDSMNQDTVNSNIEAITGTLTVKASNGVATFSDLTFNTATDWGYSLAAGSDYAVIGVSDPNADQQINSFETGVLPAGSQPDNTPEQMVITQQPTIDPATGTFSVTAAILDRQGNPVANGSLVELQLYSGPAGASLSSTNGGSDVSVVGNMIGGNGSFYSVETATASVDANGYATFTGLAVNVSGTYVLALGDGTPVSLVLSNPFQATAYQGPVYSPPINPFPSVPVIVISSNEQTKFAAAPPLPSSAPGLNAFAKGSSTIANQLLNPEGAAGGVLSILNSPFSGATTGNPLLS